MNAVSIKELISDNPYVGRGIIAGLSSDGKNAVAAYFIMGRSENSRNRVFEKQSDGTVITKAFDESKVTDPSLIIYNALRVCGKRTVLTNGDQTDTIADALSAGNSFESALESRQYEPDSPNFTPRISAILDFTNGYTYKLSILKKVQDDGDGCNRFTFSYVPAAGIGSFIHTYNGDGNPLPSFTGEPETVKVASDIDAFTSEVWEALNENNRISLYVCYVSLADGAVTERIVNKNK